MSTQPCFTNWGLYPMEAFKSAKDTKEELLGRYKFRVAKSVVLLFRIDGCWRKFRIYVGGGVTWEVLCAILNVSNDVEVAYDGGDTGGGSITREEFVDFVEEVASWRGTQVCMWLKAKALAAS